MELYFALMGKEIGFFRYSISFIWIFNSSYCFIIFYYLLCTLRCLLLKEKEKVFWFYFMNSSYFCSFVFKVDIRVYSYQHCLHNKIFRSFGLLFQNSFLQWYISDFFFSFFLYNHMLLVYVSMSQIIMTPRHVLYHFL